MMRTRLVLASLAVAGLVVPASRGDEPAHGSKAGQPAPGSKPAPAPRKADSDAPLPEGWPDATKPGAIEVKAYPAYRSAVARAKDASAGAGNTLFWPLFNHISRREIAMTAPVVSTYRTPGMAESPGSTGEMTMEFLYRKPTQGEPGAGVGAVKVEDHPSATYACLGYQGRSDPERLRDELATLRRWLADHKAEWVEAGPPRQLGYHGPMTPEKERLWEVQIPVKPATAKPSR
ncbi:SOUL heme-binding protein [Aquisphaera giovannonii]|uniref:SOUL heme-binding protein n=1 Tax=Aquisphaera giovannonii TaxID=406548 RepID=A0A5B9VUF1_9BACT|nr:heme-binding protein [Aquisphaera giovannonii]QEH31902.1 SOUL heme-binding protein [Aquisphaera giovannonii]